MARKVKPLTKGKLRKTSTKTGARAKKKKKPVSSVGITREAKRIKKAKAPGKSNKKAHKTVTSSRSKNAPEISPTAFKGEASRDFIKLKANQDAFADIVNHGLTEKRVPAPANNAKALVYSVMRVLLPATKIADGTELSKIGYDDFQSKDIIRGTIDDRNWHNVNLGFGALDGCSKISDITKIVKAAER
jgi:hypothetical protein